MAAATIPGASFWRKSLTKFNLQVQYIHCNNAGKNQAFKKKLKTGRAGDWLWIYRPQVCLNKWACWAQVCYPFQLGICHAQQSQIYCLSTKQSLGRSCEHCHIPQEPPDHSQKNLKPISTIFGKGKKSVLTSMQKFGEMCLATYKNNTHQAKLANHGTPSIWVGYAENHPTGTYPIFNPKTKKIILTQDVTFLQKSYSEYTH